MDPDLDTIPKRMRWILDHRTNPKTERVWKGNELGRAANIPSIAHVNMIARGEIREPSQALLRAVAAEAPVSANWLITGEGSPDSDDDARPPSISESDTPHLVNAIGYDDALAEAKRREPKLRPHAWEALEGSKHYALRGIVQPEDLIKLARVYDELADPARMGAALAAQDERIKQLLAERAEKVPEPPPETSLPPKARGTKKPRG